MAFNEHRDMPLVATVNLDPALLPFTGCDDELPERLVPFCRLNLEQIDSALSDVCSRMNVLRRQMESLHANQQACRSLLSPVRRLPNEVLIYLIQSCFKDPTLLDADNRQTFSAVRSICRRWRAISFSTRDFWRGVSTRIEFEDSIPYIGRKLETWFNRGGADALLKLGIDGSLPGQVQRLLLDPKWRWNHLSLSLPTTTNLEPFLHSQRNNTNLWDHVQHLGLQHLIVEPIDEVVPSTLFYRFMNAKKSCFPALRSLNLEQACLTLRMDDEPLFHATLTTLCMSFCSVTFHMMHNIANPENLPHLRDLALSRVSLARIHGPFTMASHPGIRRVILTGATTAAFIPMLTFPNLEFIEVSHMDGQSSIAFLESLLERSGSHIHTLLFRGDVFALACDQMASLACSLPQLRHLQISHIKIFEDLATKPPESTIKLEMVSFGNIKTKITRTTVNAIFAYLERREKLMDDPARFMLRFIDEVALMDQEEFQRLRRCARLRIQLLSPGQMNPTSPTDVFDMY
ncbi:hypothetical protein BKA70DRAFT_1314437 [Coprinopsis sp. MPI-PUGE-AT-0042]|nr:hypothetical protein BKA70DRAFT_1314437 [Coprinopsis sp. MPI-PUGE-AT-0042]